MFGIIKNFYAKKKVLITGGAGFIGSNLVESLVKTGAAITVVDNCLTGRVGNLKAFLHRINFYNIDINDFANFSKILATDFDVIFHLAAVSSVPQANKNTVLCWQTNVLSFERMLKFLEGKSNVPQIVFSSSGSVYGSCNDACAESFRPNPQSPYADSKLAGENILERFSSQVRVGCFALRYFNVYGNREPRAGFSVPVIPAFRQRMLHREPLSIFGDGHQVRDFVDVKKVVLANLLMPVSGLTGFHVFNVASGQPISVLGLIANMAKSLKVDPVIEFNPPRDGDVKASIANCEKLDTLIKDLSKC